MAGTSMHVFGAGMTVVQEMQQRWLQICPKLLEAGRSQLGDGPSTSNECQECRHSQLQAVMDTLRYCTSTPMGSGIVLRVPGHQ
jgi:hypothetical protein